METRPTSRGSDGRAVSLETVLAAVFAAVAYRRLWLDPGGAGFDEAMFQPGAVPVLLVLAVAAFVLWHQAVRLRALPGPGAPLPALGLAALAAGWLVWSERTAAPALLLPSLAATGLAVATALRGGAGARVVLLPAFIVLLGVGLPKPLEDEVVWQLQRGTASGAAWLLDALGREVFQSGVILRDVDHQFHVIDGCSGLSGIAILLLVALLVRELFADGGARPWGLVLLAPPLGFALNVVRVAYVAASPDPEALAGIEGDHTPQGLAVLMVGTAVLYVLGWAMARAPAEAAPDAPQPTLSPSAPRAVVAGMASLALLSVVTPRFSEAERAASVAPLAFPTEKAGWSSEPAPSQRLFEGQLSGGFHRRYSLRVEPSKPSQIVDLLVGFEAPDTAHTFRLLSSKLAFPGPDWSLVSRQRQQIWLLDREADVALSRHAEQHAVSYAWRPRDRGLWREVAYAWLALDASPWRRERPRAAVRLVAYAPHDGELALDRARQRLDGFVTAFREELGAL